MSRHHERKEKDCLNCGTVVHGRFCHLCGQENIEPKESFWHMVMHFFNDITHFDGKFFVTLKDLLFKPGFLSAEYMKGRRASYLHPIRMYVFTSAIFFLIFFAVREPKDIIRFEGEVPYTMGKRDTILQQVREKLANDPANFNLQTQLSILSDTSKPVKYSDLLPYADDFNAIGTFGGKYKTKKEYDSMQKALPAGQRDGWLKRVWNRRATEYNEKYRYQRAMSMEKTSKAILHQLPYLLFVSLPIFALLLKLLYIRRKNYYYADHGVFSIHHYIFSFILLLFLMLIDQLDDVTGWRIWGYIILLTNLVWAVYLYIALKRFYRQGWIKTFFKFLLLNLLGLIMIVVLFAIFTLFAVFSI